MKIIDIKPNKILDSAGNWTIETEIILEGGFTGIASVPRGVSKGKSEATALPIDQAIKNTLTLKDQLIGKIFVNSNDFDVNLLQIDGTKDKAKLGANTMLALSIAFLKAAAKARNLETYQYVHELLYPEIPIDTVIYKLPKMMMLMLEGGAHGSSDASIQEFMAIVDTIDRGSEIYKNIKHELDSLGKSTNVGSEGAFSPEGFDNYQSLLTLSQFIKTEQIALDIAASSFEPNTPDPDYDKFINEFPIYSIEDPCKEDEWSNWEYFASKNLHRVVVVTDDLTTTNPTLLREAISRRVGNAIIIKPNQIGTMLETLKVVNMATETGWQIIVSHRGTDTNDDFIADLAVGVGANFTKFGSPARGERIAKYNRLLQISKQILKKEV